MSQRPTKCAARKSTFSSSSVGSLVQGECSPGVVSCTPTWPSPARGARPRSSLLLSALPSRSAWCRSPATGCVRPRGINRYLWYRHPEARPLAMRHRASSAGPRRPHRRCAAAACTARDVVVAKPLLGLREALADVLSTSLPISRRAPENPAHRIRKESKRCAEERHAQLHGSEFEMKTNFTKEQIDGIAREYVAGASLITLSKKHHCTQRTIKAALSSRSIAVRPTGRNPRYPDSLIAETYRREGSITGTARALNMSPAGSAYRLMKANVLPPRHAPGRAEILARYVKKSTPEVCWMPGPRRRSWVHPRHRRVRAVDAAPSGLGGPPRPDDPRGDGHLPPLRPATVLQPSPPETHHPQGQHGRDDRPGALSLDADTRGCLPDPRPRRRRRATRADCRPFPR